MTFITTFTGKHFNPIEVEKEKIDIRDIAHALSLMCRANGHVKNFYSVAQHSISCCIEAKERGYSEKIQIACLLHDASEAYLSDITRPIKPKLTEYLAIEENLQDIIWDKYLEEPLTEEEREKVFEIDDDILSYEFKLLMPKSISENYKNVISKPSLHFVDPIIIENKFIELMNRENINNSVIAY